MTMNKLHPQERAAQSSIDDLVADLTPVRPMRPAHGIIIVAAMTMLAVLVTALGVGLRPDIMAGDPHIMVMQRTLVLLLLGATALVAVVETVQPRVGARTQAWTLGLFIAAAFPTITLFTAARSLSLPIEEMTSPTALWCLGVSLSSALCIGTALTLWARRGAVMAMNRTAWLIGLAAGAFGTMAYSLHCPSTTLSYVGIWYSAAVGTSALAGRMIIPPLLRW